MQLKVDPRRWATRGDHEEPTSVETGYAARALGVDGKYDDFDIIWLDRASLRAWLRSRGGANDWAEAVVEGLLGHPPVH